MSNWSDNPKNFLQEYQKAVIPKLVFDECRNWWLKPGTKGSDITAAMHSCLDNCHEKHIRAFDLFMDVTYFNYKKKDITEYIDLDAYTEMETKLGHDMFKRGTHNKKLQETDDTKQFIKDVKNEFGSLRSHAL